MHGGGVGDVTVAELLQSWVPPETRLADALERVGTLIGTQELQRALRSVPPHAAALTAGDGVAAASLAGEKFLKALASEYAFLSFPKGDTAKLTNVARVLLSSDTFDPELEKFLGATLAARKVFMPFLALLLWARGIPAASSLLLPVLRSVMCTGDYAVSLPAILCWLRPGESFGRLTHEQQIELLVEELGKRGVCVSREAEASESSESAAVRYTVRVKWEEEAESCKKGVTLPGFYAIVTGEGKKFVAREKLSKKTQRAHFTLSPVNMKMWMHEVRHLLRFRPPYADVLPGDFLAKVTFCEGWIPLSEMCRVLATRSAETRALVPSEGALQQLLENHDHFQRYEVGVCEVAGGAFTGQLCARALYAHVGASSLCTRIFERFATVKDPSACPTYAWASLQDKKQLDRGLRKGPYILHENLRFVQVFPAESLAEFSCYQRETPLEAQYDEKLGVDKPLCFLEFCLRAAVRDEKMEVLQSPQRGEAAVHWYVFSDRKEDPDEENLQVPRYYFTGRVATLRRGVPGDAAHGDETTTTAQEASPPGMAFGWRGFLKNVEPVGFSEEEVRSIFGSDRTDAHRDDGGDAAAATQEEEFVISSGVSVTAPLDTEAARSTVLSFVQNSDLLVTRVTFPRRPPGGGLFFNRQKTLTEFKAWLVELGLVYRSPAAAEGALEEVYEIRKRGRWSQDFIDGIAKELELEDIPDRELLLRAVTRECESKEMNYETLEFLGDAVVDFVVAFDSFLLGEPWKLHVVREVCCNEVFAHLIPASLSATLAQIYPSLSTKVRADMMEAIMGAVYRSQMGLDRVRQQLRHFFSRIPAALAMGVEEQDTRTLLEQAAAACPYLRDDAELLEERYKYACLALIDEGSAAEFVSSVAHSPASCCMSHYASTPFKRIQDKEYATHFTTGSIFSYRRIPSIDVPALFNRILDAFSSGATAFVNEIITGETHLTFDVDGLRVTSCGVARMIWEWFCGKFASRSAMLLLDCSGMSVVTKKMKRSCHIHFPQAVTSLERVLSLTDDLRRHIVGRLAFETHLGDVLGFRGREGSAEPAAVIGQIVFATAYAMMCLPRERDIICSDPFLEYLDLRSMLCLGGTCAAVRHRVFAYLTALAKPPAGAAGLRKLVPNCYFFAQSDGSSDQYVLMKVCWASKDAAGVVGNFMWCPVSRLVELSEEQLGVVESVERVVDGKAMKPKEFFLGQVTPLREKSFFAPAFWFRVIDQALVESRKLRMYLNDKYDMVYGKEYRPLFLDSVFHVQGTMRAVRPDKGVPCGVVRAPTDALSEEKMDEYPVEMAHASVLRLTSLRCPEYRDVQGLRRHAWWDGCDDDAHLGDFDSIRAVDDRLKSFEDYQTHGGVPGDGWEVWLNATCGIVIVGAATSQGSDAVKTAALQPAYWTFAKKTRQARLLVAGEVMLAVGPCETLQQALEQRRGMETMARHLVPSITMKELPIDPRWLTAYAEDVFPLFLGPRKKPAAHAAEHAETAGPPRDTAPTTSAGRSILRGLSEKKKEEKKEEQEEEQRAAAAPNSGPSTTLRPPPGRKVRLLLDNWDGSGRCTGQVYAAIVAAFRGPYRASLFVTAEKGLFAFLSQRFPCVVSPQYFTSSPVKKFGFVAHNLFDYVFVVDRSAEPYSNGDLLAAMWRSLAVGTGRMYASSEDIRKCLLL
ncbi:putative RNase III domain protein [Trypanosoma conorhini]|nr:putative RNase III domain protein [Trypanosoma conorhini]RNF03164.1 putative RNase III domain protein [Trypanosoma conorhini]